MSSPPSSNYSSPQEKIRELQKLLEEKEEKIQELESELREARRTPEVQIVKEDLEHLVSQGKTNKELADYYGVSVSTIKRRVREYGLTGIRKPGGGVRKEKEIEVPEIEENWIPVEEYIRELDEKYHFIEKQAPAFQFINPNTLVCSDEKKNPEGEYTTVGIYFICLQSDVYFINYTRFKYSERPKDFEEIYNWTSENAFDSLKVRFSRTSFTVVRPIAYTFLKPGEKPEVVKAE
ncbi:hypothetical protein AKJ65_04870 [candidate division MSBL1 archaeon SCGC-AAA259E19]|uniref:Uncharacterized protein n=1 Tax=candidate division MSBL1 archaeon SCGC-AAA259E19 TaxID=1698264 RepID=A0A133UJ91_9EURY|nr:hypothetical protein AKJ65_04870 [candidate division MSBL1 archaeon SCGC-AAA259E19]